MAQRMHSFGEMRSLSISQQIVLTGRREALSERLSPRGWLRRVLLVAYGLVLAAAAYYHQELIEWAVQSTTGVRLSVLPLVVLAVAVAIAFAIPASPLYVACGMLYGLTNGMLVASIGALLGSCTAYAIARGLRGSAELPKLEWLADALRREGRSILLWLRLSPLVPLSSLNIGAGLLRIGWKDFLVTLPATLVSVVLYVYAGHIGDSVVQGGFGVSDGLGLSLIVLAFAGLVLSGWKLRSRLRHARDADSAAATKERPHVRVDAPQTITIHSDLRRESRPDRRIGVEIEVGDISVEDAAREVARVFHGRLVEQQEPMIQSIETELGTFKVERDSGPLKRAAATEPEDRDLRDELLLRVVEPWVPTEIITPPLPVSELARLDQLVVALREAGARDTHRSILDAFGLHLNPELEELSANTILSTLRAFFLLRDWLREDGNVDWSRRAYPYIEQHGDKYVKLVMNPDYCPDIDTLVDDYVRVVGSRNRELDLLPLLAHLRPERVAELDDERVNARPTWHYRLPNCEVENPDWSIRKEWRRWKLVEALARDEALLMKCIRSRAAQDGSSFFDQLKEQLCI